MPSRRTDSLFRSALTGIFLSALFCLLLFTLVAEPVRVEGTSMTPSLNPHQRLIVSPLLARLDLRRSDIVILEHPRQPGVILIKRVIALAGDRVRIDGRSIRVNGHPVALLQHAAPQAVQDFLVPPGQVFVLGDNLDDSVDSRRFGPVPLRSIRGKAVFRYWPLSRIGFP